MLDSSSGRRGSDAGFTLVEILVAIVLVGILSAVVVVGVGRIVGQGADAGCTASADAARAGAKVFWTGNGRQPTTFTEMATAGALDLPDGVAVDVTGLVASGDDWDLRLVPGTGIAVPTFVCSSGTAPAGFTMGPTGHYYAFVSGTMSWSAASAAAATYSDGVGTGYLATITSQAEQDFVYALTGTTNSAWLGGTDGAVEGLWRWTVGPEAGTQFSTGSAPYAGAYARWASAQPDDAGSNEDCLHIYRNFGNVWNDVPCNWPNNTGYVVEIGG